MLERFTDRARKVMQLANQEAQRHNHDYIEPGHILIALVREETGVGGHVLINLGVTVEKARQKFLEIVPPGPDMITMGKLPQTPSSRKVIERAIEWAKKLQHSYVGTEHLAMGLVSDANSALTIINNLGVTADNVERDVKLFFERQSKDKPTAPDLQLAKEFLDAVKKNPALATDDVFVTGFFTRAYSEGIFAGKKAGMMERTWTTMVDPMGGLGNVLEDLQRRVAELEKLAQR